MDTIEIIQIIVYILGLVGFGFKIVAIINKSTDLQRIENRTDHAKLFDTINTMAIQSAQHEEKFKTTRRDINGIRNDIEIIEMKNDETAEKVHGLEKEIIKVGKVG